MNADNVAACQSGTSALYLSLVEAGVKFRSVCEEECEWDGESLKYSGAIVKAIVVVHVFGNMANMEFIMETSEKYNFRVIKDATEALGVAQSEEISEFIERKQRNYNLYKELFDDFEYGTLMPFRDGIESNKWFYSINIDRRYIIATMREIIDTLQDKGIEIRAIWNPINEQKTYEGGVTYKLEKAPYCDNRILNIPSSTQITEEEIRFVVDEVKQLLRKIANG